uniref:Uncharacterized protein n=1 Tax=Plectus sambesii TaxID=2011161 RepID=A0A914XL08_9BILA
MRAAQRRRRRRHMRSLGERRPPTASAVPTPIDPSEKAREGARRVQTPESRDAHSYRSAAPWQSGLIERGAAHGSTAVAAAAIVVAFRVANRRRGRSKREFFLRARPTRLVRGATAEDDGAEDKARCDACVGDNAPGCVNIGRSLTNGRNAEADGRIIRRPGTADQDQSVCQQLNNRPPSPVGILDHCPSIHTQTHTHTPPSPARWLQSTQPQSTHIQHERFVLRNTPPFSRDSHPVGSETIKNTSQMAWNYPSSTVGDPLAFQLTRPRQPPKLREQQSRWRRRADYQADAHGRNVTAATSPEIRHGCYAIRNRENRRRLATNTVSRCQGRFQAALISRRSP